MITTALFILTVYCFFKVGMFAGFSLGFILLLWVLREELYALALSIILIIIYFTKPCKARRKSKSKF
jgi:hypothetical protein